MSTIINPKVNLAIWQWAGPARTIRQYFTDLLEESQGVLSAGSQRMYAEAAIATTNFEPDQPVVVEIRYPGTSRQHVVVAPCHLLV